MQPLVSWLITVYNCKESKIRRAFDSMLASTYKNYEIVVVLEAGTDEVTKAVCYEYAQKEDCIFIYENQTRLGIAKSLNIGLEHCRGKYIARMDADDYSYPDRIEKQLGFMEIHSDVGILGGNARIIDKNGNIAYRYDGDICNDRIRAYLLFGTCFMHPTIMIRNDGSVKKYPERMCEDYALFMEMMQYTKMHISSEVAIDYYQDGDNISSNRFAEVRRDCELISREALKKYLDFDSKDYPQHLFGWRTLDLIAENPFDYLKVTLSFYHSVLKRNEELSKFDKRSLSSVIYGEWKKALKNIRPYSLPELDRSVEKISDDDIEALRTRAENEPITNEKIVLYGAGNISRTWLRDIRDIGSRWSRQKDNVICICDSDDSKLGEYLEDKLIMSPQLLLTTQYDKVAISTVLYKDEVKKKITEMGVPTDKIANLPLPEVTLLSARYYSEQIKICKTLKNERVTYLFCSPDYGNIGDHAIAIAEHRFLKKYYGVEPIDIPCLFQKYLMPFLKKTIKKDDILIITGGGFMGSLWPDGENRVREIVREFPENKIISFPQTIYWSEDRYEFECEASALYKTHKNFTVIPRDSVSEIYAQKCYSEKLIGKAPDMTLAVDWEDLYTKGKREGVLICLKNDIESILSDNDKRLVYGIARSFFDKVEEDDNTREGRWFLEDRERLVSGQLNKWARTEVVITDRLHGAMFSVITGTPCIMFDNCNHKLSSAYEWLSDIPNIFFVKKPADLYAFFKNNMKELKEVDFDPNRWSDKFKVILNAQIYE